jgi:predicted RNA-binding Zn ribbon-like protein
MPFKTTPRDDPRYPPWTATLEPAPGDLRIVQAFVNTRDIDEGTDELSSPAALTGWLEAWGLLPAAARLGEADLASARAVREALRNLLLANNGEVAEPRDIGLLDRAARSTRLRARFAADGSAAFEPAVSGWRRALSRLLEIVVVEQIQGRWPRLKACRNEPCRWAFYDYSKNRSGKWCTMRRCGNLTNARAYRQRRRGTGTRT